MKNYIIIFLGIIFLSSCDPDVPGEGITLPEMKFGFKIDPGTAYIELGDTITISSSIPSTLSNGIKITDGKATIDLNMAYSDEIPIETNSLNITIFGEHFNYEIEKGEIRINPTTNKIVEVYAIPYGDSIQVEIKFIPLKVGTYNITVSSMFFEGSQGKTRTQPYFDLIDNNGEELWKVPGMPALTPDDPDYKRLYYFAVYE